MSSIDFISIRFFTNLITWLLKILNLYFFIIVFLECSINRLAIDT